MDIATFAETIYNTGESVRAPGHQHIGVMKPSFLPVIKS